MPLHAQEDAYHAGLRAMLQDQYNISGGKWLLGNTEETTLGHAMWSGVNSQQLAAPAGRTFTKMLQINAAVQRLHSWDAYIRFPALPQTQPGDALLLIVWINSLESTKEVTHIFEMTQAPNTKSLCAGAQIKPGWQLWMLPFTAQNDHSAGHYQLNLGGMSGKVQISAPAIINFSRKYPKYQLPALSPQLIYTGREDSAPWRARALQRIEDIRKGELRIQVINTLGQAVESAEVHLAMQQHDFGFGSAIIVQPWLQPSADGAVYLDKLQNLDGKGHSFNVAVLENALKWPVWENESQHGTKAQAVQIIQWLRSRNYRIRGHNLIWPVWGAMPADMKQNAHNLPYLTNRIRSHFLEILSYPGIHGQLGDWDAINEPLSCRDLEIAFATDAIYADWFKWAREADPTALLYMNENEMLGQTGTDSLALERFKAIIQRLVNAKAPIDGIGVQGHMKYGLTPPQRLLDIFDDLGRFRKEISITEYDAVNVNDDVAADYMRDILIAVFSHPLARNFIMWGFWDGAHWQSDAPLFNRDWSLKPSGEVFLDYVFNKWWSNAKGKSDNNGSYAARVFYGRYLATVQYGGKSVQQEIVFNRAHPNTVIIVQPDLTAPKAPSGLAVGLMHPAFSQTGNNKDFDDQRLNLLSSGQTATDLPDISLEAPLYPSSLYYNRLIYDKAAAARKMLLIK